MLITCYFGFVSFLQVLSTECLMYCRCIAINVTNEIRLTFFFFFFFTENHVFLIR